MSVFPFELQEATGPALGLVVLQTDLRIESDFRRILPGEARLFVSRVPSGTEVTPDTLGEMQDHLPAAAALLPPDESCDVVGYGCTSGTARIGSERIADLVRQGARAKAVTEPVSALVAACAELGLTRLALLSPYIEPVSRRLRDVLDGHGIETPVFGSFDEAEEIRVARIAPESIRRAAGQLARQGQVDGLFLSCTNLNTLDVIHPLQDETGLPVLSSNLVLGWHMCRLAGLDPVMDIGTGRAGPVSLGS